MADTVITKQDLIDASADANTLAQVVNGDVETDVQARLGEIYPSLSKALYSVIQTGGFEPFQTESALLASVPTVSKKAAKALDTKKIWYWGGASWVDTGLSELELSKEYFDNSIEIVNKNLCTHETLKNARYVNASGSIEANSAAAMHVIKIEAGKIYAIKSPSFLASAFLVALRANNSIDVGTTLGLVTLNDTADATVKTFTVSASSTAQYAFINVLLPSLSFDIRSSIVVNEGTTAENEHVTKIKNATISDEFARAQMLKKTDVNLAKNLYTGTNQASRYVNASGSIEANSTTAMHVLPVTAGKTYAVKGSLLVPSAFLIAFRSSASVTTGATLGLATLNATKDLNARTFTVPDGATHAFINVLLPALGLDIRDSLIIQQSNMIVELDAITEINSNKIADTTARQQIESLNLVATSNLKGKKWVVIGDSITAENQRSHYKYHYYVSQNVGGMTVYNYGISGTGFFGRYDVASNVTQLNVDYVSVFLGTNDWGLGGLPLGVFGDTGTGTVAGCINTTLLALVEKFYKAKIVIFTPLPRRTSYGIDGGTLNAQNYHLSAIADLLKQYAEHYSLPLLDLYSESNMHPWLPASDDFYFKPFEGSSYGSTPDGLHPNDAGHTLIAHKIQKFLESV